MANPLEPVVNELKEKLKGLGFSENAEAEGGLTKDVSENFGMVFYHDEGYPLCFGFFHYNGKKFSPTQLFWLKKEVFGRWEFTDDFGDNFEDMGDQWLCKRMKHKGWSNQDIIDFLVSRYDWLEKTVQYLEIT
jgi:hypothetical protein